MSRTITHQHEEGHNVGVLVCLLCVIYDAAHVSAVMMIRDCFHGHAILWNYSRSRRYYLVDM